VAEETEESGLKYFLHTFRTALTVGSTYSLSLLLVILRLLKKYLGWTRIEAAYTEGYLPNVHIIIQIAYFTMLGTLASYATAYLGIIETIETVETKRGVVLLKRNRQVFMFH